MKQLIGIATTTCPNEKAASSIVGSLLKENLIACGQVEGPVKTNYLWKGKLVSEDEWRVTMKFALEKRKELESRTIELHPYEVPQWVSWEATASELFCKWVYDPKQVNGD
jgi:periplasmic divalent cation tolerance protein